MHYFPIKQRAPLLPPSSVFPNPSDLSAATARSPAISSPPPLLPPYRSMATTSRWLRPEAYPLFAAVGAAVGICAFSLIRNITGNPEVRVLKENRAAGVLDNFVEGEKYAQHSLRKFVRGKSPEIMPSINKFFTDPQ